MGIVDIKSDGEYFAIGDEGDLGYIDIENNKSRGSYDLDGESEIVVISAPFALVNGRLVSGSVGETIVNAITVKNITDDSLDLSSIKIYDSKPEDSFTLSLMEPPTATSDVDCIEEFVETFSVEDRTLWPGQTLTVWLSCKPKEIGLHTSAVHFNVGDETIERLVFVLAEDKVCQSLVSNWDGITPPASGNNWEDIPPPASANNWNTIPPTDESGYNWEDLPPPFTDENERSDKGWNNWDSIPPPESGYYWEDIPPPASANNWNTIPPTDESGYDREDLPLPVTDENERSDNGWNNWDSIPTPEFGYYWEDLPPGHPLLQMKMQSDDGWNQ